MEVEFSDGDVYDNRNLEPKKPFKQEMYGFENVVLIMALFFNPCFNSIAIALIVDRD